MRSRARHVPIVTTWNIKLNEELKPYPFCHFVDFNVQEVQILIEVLVFEQAFTDHLRKDSRDIASAISY